MPFDAEVHHVNPTCGDEVTLRVHLNDPAGGDAVVEDVSYDVAGLLDQPGQRLGDDRPGDRQAASARR